MAHILQCDRCGSVEDVMSLTLNTDKEGRCVASGKTEFYHHEVDLCRNCLVTYGRKYLANTRVPREVRDFKTWLKE